MSAIEYVSTRGGVQPAGFGEVLLDGAASDGGLVVPTTLPVIDEERLREWRALDYADLATAVIAPFAADIPSDELAAMTHRAYAPEAFDDERIVPVTALDGGIGLVGLSEGPTWAFKDLAMRFLGEAIPYRLAATDRTLTVLGATSGDTGSAAEHAFLGAHGVRVVMLSPQGRMSPVQRAQMFSIDDPAIRNLAVEGVFDDCQDLVKTISADTAFATAHSIGAVNSINVARIIAQTVFYVWAWLRATEEVDGRAADERISFVVPSGNFGNVYAGHLARRMGVPIHRLVVATNENDVLDEFFRTGVYAPRTREHTHATSSPSMDISKASNLERFVWDLLGPERFVERWPELAREGRLDLRDELPRLREEFGFVSGSSDHAHRLDAIRDVYRTHGIVIDPHTADGVSVARTFTEPGERLLVLETAKAVKFPETVAEALGDDAPPVSDAVRALLALPQRVVDVPGDVDAIRAVIEELD